MYGDKSSHYSHICNGNEINGFFLILLKAPVTSLKTPGGPCTSVLEPPSCFSNDVALFSSFGLNFVHLIFTLFSNNKIIKQ